MDIEYIYEYKSKTGKSYTDQFYWAKHSKNWSRHRYSHEEDRWFHDEFDDANFQKMRKTMYNCPDLTENKKKKFFDGIEKRKLEREAEEAYWENFEKWFWSLNQKQKLEIMHKWDCCDELTSTEQEAVNALVEDEYFMNEYHKWQDEYGRIHTQKIDSYGRVTDRLVDNYAYDEVRPANKIIKPLDRPELHQALKEGMNMCLSQKAVNKLNGLKVGEEKFVELTQASSESKTVTIDLVSLLQGTEQFKGLKLGKEALLKAVDFSGDSLSVKLSLGSVAREENAMMQAALVQLVNSTRV